MEPFGRPNWSSMFLQVALGCSFKSLQGFQLTASSSQAVTGLPLLWLSDTESRPSRNLSAHFRIAHAFIASSPKTVCKSRIVSAHDLPSFVVKFHNSLFLISNEMKKRTPFNTFNFQNKWRHCHFALGLDIYDQIIEELDIYDKSFIVALTLSMTSRKDNNFMAYAWHRIRLKTIKRLSQKRCSNFREKPVQWIFSPLMTLFKRCCSWHTTSILTATR